MSLRDRLFAESENYGLHEDVRALLREAAESTPHPAQAASQGDAEYRRGYAEGVADSRKGECACTRTAALSSPPGVQAAQVSDADVERVCKLVAIERWPDSYDADEQKQMRRMVRITMEHTFAQPGSAAHGGEDAVRQSALALREAQRAYMADRGNEVKGKAVAAAAERLDAALGVSVAEDA